jgi:hypothetical protein
LPGDGPQPYAVYVDETDAVWVSDWGANAILRFDPNTGKFESFPLPDRYANVRQLAGGKGEVWGGRFVWSTEGERFQTLGLEGRIRPWPSMYRPMSEKGVIPHHKKPLGSPV